MISSSPTRKTDRNRDVYSAAEVVADFVSRDYLSPDEESVFRNLGADLAGMSLLDVGIGGGRTTARLLGKVREYVGIDYSEPMIAACRRRFPSQPEQVLQVGDVQRLEFPDARFDFVFFSYNGLDYIGHAERLAALREMRRVGKPGSLMAFSSHNLLSLGCAPASPPSGTLPRLRQAALRVAVRFVNGGLAELRARDHAVIRDEARRFRLRTYYVNPAAQVRQLEEAGFHATRLFARDGREVRLEEALRLPDEWFHYLARNGKA